MTKKHRKILDRLRIACQELSSHLDLTAVHPLKLKDRQEAHGLVARVIYGVLVDHPDNPYQDEDMKIAMEAMEELERLPAKEYPRRFTEE